METPRQEALIEDKERPVAPDLPLEVLETICAPLELRDRLRLTACCAALWHRGDIASSAALWGALSIQKPLEIPAVRRSLAAWLRRRSAALRRLHLGRTGASPAPLLAELAGSPLGALSLAGSTAVGLDPESTLQPLAVLPALSHLDLGACTLRALPAALGAIPSLASLALPSNPHLGTAGPAGWETLAHLVRLTALSLAGCDLERLPAQLGELTGLRELSVGANMMVGKSGAAAFQPLSALRRLRRLEAGSCCLAALPPLLSCCAVLESLELPANPSLGTASLQPLALLSCITLLDLSSCGLSGLPAPLSGLTTLRALCLAGNALGAGEQGAAAGSDRHTAAPRGSSSGGGGFGALSRLTALTSLSLAGCCLPALPGEVGSLSALQSLDLGDNGMLGPGSDSEGGGWEALRGLSALTRLEISTCGLCRLPPEVSSLSRLRCLGLGGNRLVGERGAGAFGALAHLHSLCCLDLSECVLDHVPAVLGTLRCLRNLNLARNVLLGERGSTAFEHLAALRGLTHLDLRNCRLEGALPAGLGALVSLRELLLSWNGELGHCSRAEAAWGVLARLPALERLEIVRCGLAAAGAPASMVARSVRVKL